MDLKENKHFHHYVRYMMARSKQFMLDFLDNSDFKNMSKDELIHLIVQSHWQAFIQFAISNIQDVSYFYLNQIYLKKKLTFYDILTLADAGILKTVEYPNSSGNVENRYKIDSVFNYEPNELIYLGKTTKPHTLFLQIGGNTELTEELLCHLTEKTEFEITHQKQDKSRTYVQIKKNMSPVDRNGGQKND